MPTRAWATRLSYDTTGCVVRHIAKLHLFRELHCVMGFDDLLDHVVRDLRLLHMALTRDAQRFQREAYRVASYEKECIWAGEQAPPMPAWTLLPFDYV